MVRTTFCLAILVFVAGSASPCAGDEPKNSKYAMTGDGAIIDNAVPFRVEGVGFVVGLQGTGSNPPPNNYRKLLLDQMKKRGVENPVEWIESPNTSIVLLRAFIPPGIRKNDPVDVEVWVPPGDETTSLKGGYLLESEVMVHLATDDRDLKGDTYVKVDGPVLVTIDPKASEEERAASLRKGRVLGRGRCIVDRDFKLTIEDGKKSTRLSKRVAFRINQRFRSPDSGSKGIAKPLDYQHINLAVPPEYRHDAERFLHVVRRIPMSESKSFEDRLLGILETELMHPATAIEASLRLEAIGGPGIPTLQEGLNSEHELVRFCSAQALAYLNDPTGFKQLAEFADRSNTYRGHALTALAAGSQPIARTHLVKLLASQSSEARYGAFRALWTLNPRDQIVRSMKVGPDEFSVHAVPTDSEPMVHVARSFRPEIVLFNPKQQLLTPLNLRAGDNMVITASAGSEEVHIASFAPGPSGPVESRRIASLSLGDVIVQAGQLGARYPDVVDMLMQASASGNLSGRLEINALPKQLGLDTLQAIGNDDEARRWQAFQFGTPNLFGSGLDTKIVPKATAFDSLPAGEVIEEDELDDEQSDAPSPAPKRRWWQLGGLRGAAN